jgi:hypothetical protein
VPANHVHKTVLHAALSDSLVRQSIRDSRIRRLITP